MKQNGKSNKFTLKLQSVTQTELIAWAPDGLSKCQKAYLLYSVRVHYLSMQILDK